LWRAQLSDEDRAMLESIAAGREFEN